jgi:hypothetical protein
MILVDGTKSEDRFPAGSAQDPASQQGVTRTQPSSRAEGQEAMRASAAIGIGSQVGRLRAS